MTKLWVLFGLIWVSVVAGHPADISYFVLDIKYNEVDGPKICEVNQGIAAGFYGRDALSGRKETAAEKLCDLINQYFDTIWFVREGYYAKRYGKVFENLDKTDPRWRGANTFRDLITKKGFRSKARNKVDDPSNIDSYRGLVICHNSAMEKDKEFKSMYPGVLFLSSPFYFYFGKGYFTDKERMASLFSGHEVLERLKPKWGKYRAGCSSELVTAISEKISSEYLIIKPLQECRGKGVIVFPKGDLAETLEILFGNRSIPEHLTNSGYEYWKEQDKGFFLVEEYIPSDPVSPPSDPNHPYDGTLRIGLVVIHSEGITRCHAFESYWSLPGTPLDGEGTLYQKRINSVGTLHFCEVEPEIVRDVEERFVEAFHYLYTQVFDQ